MSIDLIKENGLTLKETRYRKYPGKTIIDADYRNTSVQAESLLNCLEQAAGSISIDENRNKTESMCFRREKAISSL